MGKGPAEAGSTVILVAGEALIDMLPLEAGGMPCLRPVPGGSPFNVARALSRLGISTRFLCRLSTDAFGDLLTRSLAESGVDLTDCPRTPALSTLGFVTFDAASREARYAFYTEGTAGCALGPEDLPRPLAPDLRAVHVGSFSLAVEPFGAAIEQLVLESAGRGRSAGADGRGAGPSVRAEADPIPTQPEAGAMRRPGALFVSYDPNIRPFLIPDRKRFLSRHQRIGRRADLIKLSREDLQWLHPGADEDAVVRGYLEEGAAMVVVTRGEKGSSAWNRDLRDPVTVGPPRVDVVDTVGAGDTFQAALLAWLARRGALGFESVGRLDRKEVRALLAFATDAAGVTCSRPGCDPPWLRELVREGP